MSEIQQTTQEPDTENFPPETGWIHPHEEWTSNPLWKEEYGDTVFRHFRIDAVEREVAGQGEDAEELFQRVTHPVHESESTVLYSLYGVLDDGTCEHIADRCDLDTARELLGRIGVDWS